MRYSILNLCCVRARGGGGYVGLESRIFFEGGGGSSNCYILSHTVTGGEGGVKNW